MTYFLKLSAILLMGLLFSCSGKQLVSDKKYSEQINADFNSRKVLAENRQQELFSVFSEDLSAEQTEALEFLFAYMPLNDLADYSGSFFLTNTNIALQTRKHVSWGNKIPDDIFLHYILPVRVNNENLDSFRIAYKDEILERTEGKDIESAALEINHWCHEKVNYQPADIRTSAPMSTILSARGRCGEESTFTVAALRTAGIPARQVYTPRWAHSDDNHAWVEVWINGEWYYMGACEPEPLLDRGWFTEPARRAMLVHTKSFGASYGNENTIRNYKQFTEVNNLPKYAVTRNIFIKVLDSEGLPVENAIVEYQLYNYAEFFPLAAIPTDKNGLCHFETGIGDLLIWARTGDKFDFKKISVSATDTIVLIPEMRSDKNYNIDLDLNVPAVLPPLKGISPEMAATTAERIKLGNALRQNYIDSWMNREQSAGLARELNIDSAKMINVIAGSMGNYREIVKFLRSVPDSLMNRAFELLEVISDKDLRDVRANVLTDHLSNTCFNKVNEKFFVEYILNPRVSNEMLVPWRSYFIQNLPTDLLVKASADPELIIKYLERNIKISNDDNYYKTLITPSGVNELKVSDEESRSVCFVAICRSLGIPSRLEPGRNIPQFWLNGKWNDVYFADQTNPGNSRGYIRLISTDINPVPEYHIHFSLARFENGRYNTIEYDFNRKVTDFRDELELPPGNYMLVTGNRIGDSKILSNLCFFKLSENEHKELVINLRDIEKPLLVNGKVSISNVAGLFHEASDIIGNAGKKGIAIIWIDPDQEPTRHIFNDLPLYKKELDEWGGYFLFISGSALSADTFNPESIKGLPEKSLFSSDDQMKVFTKAVSINPQPDVRLPFVILSDRSGSILLTSTGYNIGIGEQILKCIK